MHQKFEKYLLEPVNTITHLFGAAVSVAGLLLLVYLTLGQTGKMLSLVVYGLTMINLYTASALLHGARLSASRRMWLNRLDHAAIFLMIAGTYTPIIYNLFPETWHWPTLIGYWLVAVGGMLYKVFSAKIHTAFNKTIYPTLSWGGVIPAVLASQDGLLVPKSGMVYLLVGGLIYMTGFIIYYRQKPDPWPNVLGHHEIWHLFVLAGSFCHFLFMLFYVIPV
jgi:hemolysin III